MLYSARLSSQSNTKKNPKLKRSQSNARVQAGNTFHYKPFKPGPRDIGRIENTD